MLFPIQANVGHLPRNCAYVDEDYVEKAPLLSGFSVWVGYLFVFRFTQNSASKNLTSLVWEHVPWTSEVVEILDTLFLLPCTVQLMYLVITYSDAWK